MTPDNNGYTNGPVILNSLTPAMMSDFQLAPGLGRKKKKEKWIYDRKSQFSQELQLLTIEAFVLGSQIFL